jgi:hypothetical protein
VCGIHAQVGASAELSLGLRVRDITRQHVRRALVDERTLVKTYGLRGTLHLFPSQELGLWLAALGARTPPRATNPAADEALPPRQREQIVAAIPEALDGQVLTREELAAELERRLGRWAMEPVFQAFGGHWPRWQLALSQAAAHGLIVFGPNHGSRVTYVRLDQWLGKLDPVDGTAALREVALRFFAAYGPATHEEFARWFLMQSAAARELVASLAANGELEAIDVEGWKAWWLPKHGESRMQGARIHLLPHFDCYVVGCHPRRQLIPEGAPAAMQKGTAAPFSVVLIDGVVGGVWERRKRGKAFELRVDTFEPLSSAQKEEVEAQARRVGEILEAPAMLEFGRVEARTHM